MIIEIGGGNNPLYRPNVDIRKLDNVDIVANIEEGLPTIQDNYTDGLYMSYMIEHVSWRKISNFLTECYRILKPNGTLFIITANLLEQAKVLVNKEKWEENDICMIFGDQDYPDNTHKCGFSPNYIKQILTNMGFRNVEIEAYPHTITDMIVRAIK